ncbi:hypothetical protein NNM15_13600, partial [Enterococcus faecium]|nr:hypothetical protein [Enterococcus faecium]
PSFFVWIFSFTQNILYSQSLESGKKKIDLKIISSGYFKDFIVIDTKWNKKDIENILNSRNN